MSKLDNNLQSKSWRGVMHKFVLRTAKNLLSWRFLNLPFFILSISKHSEYKNVTHRIQKVSTQTPTKLEIAEYKQTLFNNSNNWKGAMPEIAEHVSSDQYPYCDNIGPCSYKVLIFNYLFFTIQDRSFSYNR